VDRLRARRCSARHALLDGTPTVLITTRDGAFGRHPGARWDHNTDYLRRILVDMWGST
jgi:FMN-dependent NADH-azoreductase